MPKSPWVVLCAALLASPLLAQQEVRIPTRDAAPLEALLHLPAGDGPWPVVVVQTPYGKERSLPEHIFGEVYEDSDGQPAGLAAYAVLVVDWRSGALRLGRRQGATASNGRQQARDGYDVVEWAASQEWCDGNVGCWGPSALGGVQYRTAEEQPPHLRCIVPMVRGLGWGYDTFYPGGVERAAYIDTLGLLFGVDRLFRKHPRRDVLWGLVEGAARPEQIEVPALLIGGWFDMHPQDMLDSFASVRAGADPELRAQHRLLLGPWEHMKVGKAEQGALRFEQAAIVEAEVRRWFDQHLRGIEAPPSAPIRYYVVHEGWREADSWPVEEIRNHTLYLTVEGDLADAEGEAGSLALPFDPADPSPTLGGNNLSPQLAHGPQDQAEAAARADAQIFETPVLQEALRLVGRVRLTLRASTDAGDADLHLRLCDVDAEGRALLIADGARRMSLEAGFRRSRTVPAGEVFELQIETLPVAWKVEPGHRLRLILTGSNAPRYAVHPQQAGTHTVHFETGLPSLELPLLLE